MPLFKGIFKYVWPQMRKYKLAFFSAIILFGIRVILDSIIKPLYLKKIIDLLSSNNLSRQDVSVEVIHFVFIFIGISIVVYFISRGGKLIYFSFLLKTIRDLRNFSFRKISNHSQTFFANTFSGSLVTKSRRFVGSFETMSDTIIYDFFGAMVYLTAVFVVLFNNSKKIALIFFIFAIIYFIIILIFIKKKMKLDIIEANADSKIGGRSADVFGNILALKIFSAQKREVDSFAEVTGDSYRKSKKAWFFGLKIEWLQSILVLITSSIILYSLVVLWIDNKISTGTVVLVQIYMAMVFEKLWQLSNVLMRFMKSAADMKEIIDIFEVTPDILDPENPEELKMNKGHLVFNNVDFVYNNNNQEVLKNFNLDIKPGERIGVVGHSGAGKSTITNLILRFMDVTAGSITIDGQDIRNVTQDDLRSAISYVPQESILFHRTIRENIAYGKPNATNEEVAEVAKKAHADEFISKLQNTYDTKVGERGVKLSGGERQRVSIARAMIKNAPILILDEATSALDSVSESYIQEAFGELMEGKTTIVIAHRLSTIQKMDRIIVLEEGNIVEQGSHKELIEKNGVYADLWNHQAGGFIE